MIDAMYWALSGNVGDTVGPWIYERMTGRMPWFVDRGQPIPKLLTCGSIIREADEQTTVWGAGAIDSSDRPNPKAKYLAVRGPLTRELVIKSGGSCPEIYGDVAALVPHFLPKDRKPLIPLAFIPHFIDQRCLGETPEKLPVLNVLWPVERFAEELCLCRAVASTSLHGIILAHAYGIPAVWLRIHPLAGDDLKFRDYFASVGLTTKTPIVPPDRASMDWWQGLSAVAELPAKPINLNGLIEACPFR